MRKLSSETEITTIRTLAIASKFRNGVYNTRRSDGNIHRILLLYDHPHILYPRGHRNKHEQTATLQGAINGNVLADDDATAQSICDITAMLTRFANVFHRSSITSTTWEKLKSELKDVSQKVSNFLEAHLMVNLPWWTRGWR